MSVAITAPAVVLLILIDQLTKYLVLLNLKAVDFFTVIPGFLQFRYVENTGAAFGIFESNTWALAVVTSIVILAGLIYLFFIKPKEKLVAFAWVFLLAGGIGNLIDRVIRHFVIDFIEFTFVDYAVFNFADILVTVGAVLLIVSVIKETIAEYREKKGKSDE